MQHMNVFSTLMLELTYCKKLKKLYVQLLV